MPGRQIALPEMMCRDRSRGGFGCKTHALLDALGMPVKYILTGGEKAEFQQAMPLTGKHQCLSRSGGQNLRHRPIEGLAKTSQHKSCHSTQIEPE